MSSSAPARPSLGRLLFGRPSKRSAGVGQLSLGLLMALVGALRLQHVTLAQLDAYDRAFPIVSGLLVAAVGALTLGEVSWGLSRRPRLAVSTIAALWFAACAVYIVVGFAHAS